MEKNDGVMEFAIRKISIKKHDGTELVIDAVFLIVSGADDVKADEIPEVHVKKSSLHPMEKIYAEWDLEIYSMYDSQANPLFDIPEWEFVRLGNEGETEDPDWYVLKNVTKHD